MVDLLEQLRLILCAERNKINDAMPPKMQPESGARIYWAGRVNTYDDVLGIIYEIQKGEVNE